MADKRLILCPYCGNTQNEPEDRCTACGGFFDSLSLKVTQEHMGPWFIRDRHNPFRPGMSYNVVKREIEKARIKPTTILKGPTTRQFWSVARNVPGVAHLVGYCHACGAHVTPTDDNCKECGEVFFAPKIRDNLGLAPLGADVSAKPKLSGSGAYAAIDPAKKSATPAPAAAGGTVATGVDTPLVLPGTKPAAPAASASPASPPPLRQPTTDQPVGSSILAGLRTDAPAAGAAATVAAASAKASASRDAMSWMTPGVNSEPDTLQTAANPTAELPKQTNVMTWILISINVLLFLVAVVAVVIVIMRSGSVEPTSTTPPSQLVAPPPDTNQAIPVPPDTNTNDTDDIADPTDASFSDVSNDANAEPVAPSPPAADPAADQRQQWQDRFAEALRLENSGDLDAAKRLLDQIKADAPAAMQPAELDTAILRVSRKIDRREIDNIFGG